MNERTELVYALALRARVLAGQPIDYLRRSVSVGDNVSGLDADTRYRNRGDLMEEILVEEFLDHQGE